MLACIRDGSVFFCENILFTDIAYLWNKNTINMEDFKTFIAYCITSYIYWSEDLAWKIKDSNRHSINEKTHKQAHIHTVRACQSCSLPSAMSLITDKVFFLWATLSPFLSPGQGLCIECEALWSSWLYQSVSLALTLIFIGFWAPQSNVAQGCVCSTLLH